jgi:hypothetical protein
MNRFCVLAAALALPLAAQAPKPADTKPAVEKPSAAQRVFVLKYADPVAMADLLRVFGVKVAANTDAHAVAVVSAFPDLIASVDDAIQRLDVPASAPQNIELTGYYILGANTNSPLGSALPKDLESVTSELTTTSGLKNYRLLDALTVRLRTGQGADTSGTAGPVAAGSPLIATDFRVRSATVSADGATVRLDRLTAGVKMPVAAAGGQYTSSDLSLNADLDIKPGQKTLAGRVGMARDQALFLILQARIAK